MNDEKIVKEIMEKDESHDLDFKEEFPYQGHSIGQIISAFSNHLGGYIYFGITDKKPREVKNIADTQDIKDRVNGIAKKCDPQPALQFKVYNLQKSTVISSYISQSIIPVSYDNRYYFRYPNDSNPIHLNTNQLAIFFKEGKYQFLRAIYGNEDFSIVLSSQEKQNIKEKIYDPLYRYVSNALLILERKHFAKGRRRGGLGDDVLKIIPQLKSTLDWQKVDNKLREIVESLPGKFEQVRKVEEELSLFAESVFCDDLFIHEQADITPFIEFLHFILHNSYGLDQFRTFERFLLSIDKFIEKDITPGSYWLYIKDIIMSSSEGIYYLQEREKWISILENLLERIISLAY